MLKSTFYCSHCGKGNVVSSPIDGQKFNCLNCRQTNTVEIDLDGGEATSQIKEVTRRQPIAAAASQSSNIHRKKTLLDKNIDLLEKIEELELDTQQLKDEYLDVSKQLSLVSNSSGGEGISEEQFDELKTSLDVIYTVQKELASFQGLKEQVEGIANAMGVVTELKDAQEQAAKDTSSVKHVMNNVAGDMKALKRSMDGIISSVNNISVSAPVVAAVGPTPKAPLAPSNTTQILVADEPAPSNGSLMSSKPKKRSRSFKAVSEQLKSLKL